MAKSDIDIAREATMLPIGEIAAKVGVPDEAIEPYGKHIAKIGLDFVKQVADRPDGRLVLVTAITPTPAGEGKTTTTVGLSDGLNRIGKKAISCTREPSLGPCFGMKGGAAGGGYAQVVPMENINLHFTGDFHAIGTAHNLLAALIDNHIYWGNELRSRSAAHLLAARGRHERPRVALAVVSSLGGVANGFPREDGFDITVASEVMAMFCLANDLADLERRLGRMLVGQTRDRQLVSAEQLKAPGPMAVLLKDAMMPNLVQTLENNPAFIHGGPFGNIAHGCNSVMATKLALKLCDYVVTEAGFGADLGGEKFFDIKCRKAGLTPGFAVIVATIRALKMHGGVGRDALGKENLAAVRTGLANLGRHIANVRKFGVPAVVAINEFATDTAAEHDLVRDYCRDEFGIEAIVCSHWADGSAGTEALAERVVAMLDDPRAGEGFRCLYPDEMPLWDKVRTIATEIYGAEDIGADKRVRDQFREFQDGGFGHFPICVAKTQYSFSTDPNLKGAPSGHIVPIREIRLSGGAEFLVVICGEIMTMPGLPRVPAAHSIRLDENGLIQGLF